MNRMTQPRRASLLALLFFLPLVGCQPEALDPPQCELAPKEGVGAWSHVALPAGVYLPGDLVASDGKELTIVPLECLDCTYATLDPSAASWRSQGIGRDKGVYAVFVSTDEYYLQVSWEKEKSLLIVERETGDVSTEVIPGMVRSSPDVPAPHWTGSEFLFWGGGRYDIDTSRSPLLYPDTPAVRFYDGALFNPSTGEWRQIPPAREDAEYLWGDGGPSLSSIWTSSGLFVWGTNPEQTENWGAIFDVESMEWTLLDTGADTPPVRKNHRLVTVGDEVFLLGGATPGGKEVWRTVWRYSLSSGTWSEVEDVPKWADPLVGTVLGDKIAFRGRCAGGELYDPVENTWTPLSVEGAPPSHGVPYGAGSFLTVTDTYYGEQETNEVWILDLREELEQ